MLDFVQHLFFDFFLMFRWLFELLKLLFEALFKPVSFFFNFLISFYNHISISYAAPITFLSQVSDVLNSLPLWSALSVIVGAGFLFLMGFKIFKLITE